MQKAKVREALLAMPHSDPAQEKYDRAAVAKQLQTREDWQRLADALAQSTTESAHALARQIRQFIAQMPAPETERMQLQKQLRQQLQQQKERTHANAERST